MCFRLLFILQNKFLFRFNTLTTIYSIFMNVVLFLYDCHFEKLFLKEVQLYFNYNIVKNFNTE